MKTSQHLALILTLALSPIIGCGDDDGAADAAVLPDGATPDAVVRDGETPDAPTPDGVTPDAGRDAATPDAGNDAGPVACEARTVPALDTELVGTFNNPVFVTAAPDDPDRLYVVEKRGRIYIIEDGTTLETPFLQIGGLRASGEQGLLGLAFHPDYATNGRFFVFNTPDSPRRNTVDEYHRSDADPMVADADRVARLVEIQDPYDNHNGGPIAFGPDGFLYVGTGDGGGGGDPDDTGLDPNTLLGSILRLDVENSDGGYAAAGNPYIDGGGEAQIWAIGIRNAWRISFDRMNGDLYVADVGQGQWEEIDVLAPGDGGANLGWSAYEGFEVYSAGKVGRVAEHHEPIHVFEHGNFDGPTVRGGVSITGGYVYRGSEIAGLEGFYLFGDYSSRDIGALHYCDGESISEQRIPSLEGVENGLSSFGEDGNGEMYMVFLSGGVYRIIPGT